MIDSMNVSGTSTCTGGVYKDVKISGAGKVEGDLECETLHCSGAGKVTGTIKSRDTHISGSFKCEGKADVGNAKCSGSAKFESDVRAEEFKSSGVTKIVGSLRAKTVRCSGSLKTEGDIEADEVKVSGNINVGGLINAEKIVMNISGESRASEVGGSDISINTTDDGEASVTIFGINVFKSRKNIFECKTVEGDNVSIDYVTSDTVRGAKVFIGKFSDISRVEYTESCEIENGAKVGECVKV